MVSLSFITVNSIKFPWSDANFQFKLRKEVPGWSRLRRRGRQRPSTEADGSCGSPLTRRAISSLLSFVDVGGTIHKLRTLSQLTHKRPARTEPWSDYETTRVNGQKRFLHISSEPQRDERELIKPCQVKNKIIAGWDLLKYDFRKDLMIL